MLATGVLLLAFLVFHILQFTTRTIQVTPVYEGTVYANLYDAFQKWYFVAHLRRRRASCSACTSATRSGASPRRPAGTSRTATRPSAASRPCVALVVAVGFASVPILFWTGALRHAVRADRRMKLDAKIPDGADRRDAGATGSTATGWSGRASAHDYKVIVVGTGLAGASAAATLAGLGYEVEAFCFQDSARRAHSIAAQGGINATKDYANEGDSVHRLFVDTIKGGDFRAREANVWRLAELSTNIIDQAVAQGVPFNREYGGLLATRSFGGVLVERTFYCRGQTGQQLLLGAYSALQQQVAEGHARSTRATSCSTSCIVGRARPRRSSPATWSPARSSATPPTRSCSRPAATATSTSSRPTRWAATSPRPGGRTSAAPGSPTPASRRSTRPASRSRASTSRS